MVGEHEILTRIFRAKFRGHTLAVVLDPLQLFVNGRVLHTPGETGH